MMRTGEAEGVGTNPINDSPVQAPVIQPGIQQPVIQPDVRQSPDQLNIHSSEEEPEGADDIPVIRQPPNPPTHVSHTQPIPTQAERPP